MFVKYETIIYGQNEWRTDNIDYFLYGCEKYRPSWLSVQQFCERDKEILILKRGQQSWWTEARLRRQNTSLIVIAIAVNVQQRAV